MLSGVILFAAGAFAPAPALHALIVGGGPDKSHNQVAIESNVRYVDRLLPHSTPRHILFADGDPAAVNVQYQDSDKSIRYRAPELPRLDGPAVLANVQQEIASLAQESRSRPRDPVLLYFTGHGSPSRSSQYENNRYDLWGGQSIDVKTLARSIDAFPANTPLTLVMVECYSGAFGNLLFEKGEPAGTLGAHHICGFFASVPQRMAAGCTPEVNEANYRDFTSYFFAALTGVDRLGKSVTGADYNRDGHVGMDEAYAYALIHDDSIDTPVCTSDVFLRHYVTTGNEQVFAANYSTVERWASQAQRAVLRELASALSLEGEGRLAVAFERFQRIQPNSEDLSDVRLLRFVRVAKSVVLAHTLMESGDADVRARYEQLVREEAGNPLRGR
ncbi:MAG TPA: hypothetical protein VKT78_13515 [Fimbriimonadaceae bacterium]|nr:hypothetical protein [Fimbriimonadaceae bacterium]